MDDPRNTDNSWMETQVYNFHDDDGRSVGAFRLSAGQCDDVAGHNNGNLIYITGAQRYEVTDFYSVLWFIDTRNDLYSVLC